MCTGLTSASLHINTVYSVVNSSPMSWHPMQIISDETDNFSLSSLLERYISQNLEFQRLNQCIISSVN